MSQCGWKGSVNVQGTDLKYIVVRITPGEERCISQAISPNADSYVDGAINVLAFLLVETVTNPLNTAFYYADSSISVGVARQCQYNFANAVTLASGAKYNLAVNGRKYYIQSIWNQKTKKCAMA